jgi:hypothetical protein
MSSHHRCSILYKPMVTTLYDAVGVTEWVTPRTPQLPTQVYVLPGFRTNESNLRYQMAAVQKKVVRHDLF